jgi:hypothetical protein
VIPYREGLIATFSTNDVKDPAKYVQPSGNIPNFYESGAAKQEMHKLVKDSYEWRLMHASKAAMEVVYDGKFATFEVIYYFLHVMEWG